MGLPGEVWPRLARGLGRAALGEVAWASLAGRSGSTRGGERGLLRAAARGWLPELPAELACAALGCSGGLGPWWGCAVDGPVGVVNGRGGRLGWDGARCWWVHPTPPAGDRGTGGRRGGAGWWAQGGVRSATGLVAPTGRPWLPGALSARPLLTLTPTTQVSYEKTGGTSPPGDLPEAGEVAVRDQGRVIEHPEQDRLCSHNPRGVNVARASAAIHGGAGSKVGRPGTLSDSEHAVRRPAPSTPPPTAALLGHGGGAPHLGTTHRPAHRAAHRGAHGAPPTATATAQPHAGHHCQRSSPYGRAHRSPPVPAHPTCRAATPPRCTTGVAKVHTAAALGPPLGRLPVRRQTSPGSHGPSRTCPQTGRQTRQAKAKAKPNGKGQKRRANNDGGVKRATFPHRMVPDN